MRKDEALKIARVYAVRIREEIDADAKVYLSGSAARDEMHEGSDIDVAVISEMFTADVIQNRVKLMLLSNEVDYDIEPHPILLEDWADRTPFTRRIQEGGIPV